MQSTEALTTHQKALISNLNPGRYGAFAEFVSGQNVVRWFFRIGGGVGTIAKSMSVCAITMRATCLRELFDVMFYPAPDGGIVASFERLFRNDLNIYRHPLLDQATGELTTRENLELKPAPQKLYFCLYDRRGINDLDNYSHECLSIFSRNVLRKVVDCVAAWETLVPESLANVIKDRKFSDFR